MHGDNEDISGESDCGLMQNRFHNIFDKSEKRNDNVGHCGIHSGWDVNDYGAGFEKSRTYYPWMENNCFNYKTHPYFFFSFFLGGGLSLVKLNTESKIAHY